MHMKEQPEELIVGEPIKGGRLYSKAEVQNRKTSATMRGIVFGALSALAIGVLVKKTTKANIVDGAEIAFDKTVTGVKGAVKSASEAAKKRKAKDE